MKGNTNCLVSSGNGKVFEGEYQLQPEAATQNIIPEWSEYNGPFEDEQTGNVSYDGLSKLKVRKIGSWIDSEISVDNIRKGHNILGVPGNVIELQGEEKTVKSTTYEQTVEPSEGKNGITKVTVSPVKYQNKTTNPTMTEQTVRPDNGYDAMSSVTVNAIDFDYLKEQEPDLVASNIKKGVEIFTVVGTYEPEYNNQTKTVDPKTYAQDIYADTGYDGLSNVHINAVTSSIDEDVKPENIRKDVNILGVKGTYEGRQPVIATVNETSTIDPKTSEQTFTVPEDKDGFDSFKVNPVTSSIDSNIKPSNIKRNVSILGVTGTYVTENLQDKIVNPTKQQQIVTYDDDVYDGLNSVTVTGVTSAIDENIKAENIKKDVEILGVTGTYEETFSTEEKTITPKTVAQSVTPSEGIDGLSRVNVEGVTSAIDANILAENIKKGIEILGVTGNLEATHYNLQDGKTVEPQLVDRTYKADEGYDALLNILVKAVTASVDPNILPKNIKEGIKILGVTGELIEGEEQLWMDYRNIKSFSTLSEKTLGGGSWSPTITDTCDNVYFTFNDPDYNAKGINTGKVSAAVFSMVMNYDNLQATDPAIEQIYVYFVNGKYYDTNYNLTSIADQISYVWPVQNEFGVNGCLLNSEDVATDKEYSLYVLINSNNNSNKPVLVDGTFATNMYPQAESLNAKEFGNIVVDKNYVASGFNINNYLKFPMEFNFGTNSWEMMFKFKYVSGSSYSQAILSQGISYETRMSVTTNNYIQLSLSNGHTSYDIGEITGTTSLSNGQIYYAKAEFTGSEYNLYLSSDGQDWTKEASLASSTVVTSLSDDWRIGVNNNGDSRYQYPWLGSIYVKECYIKVNDAFVWKGVENGLLYNQNRYVGKLTIPAHIMFIPKVTSDGKVHWVLKDRKGVESLIHVNKNSPLTVDVSAYDKNYGEEDTGVEISGVSEEFNYPTLSSNGTIGGTSFAVNAEYDGSHPAYYAFDNNSSTYWRYGSQSGGITFYNPEEIIVTQITYTPYYSYPTAGEVRGSNDDSSWSTLTSFTNDSINEFTIDLSNNETAYKYYQVYISSVNMDVIHCTAIRFKVTTKSVIATSHTIYPLTKDLLFFERNEGKGNLVNYVDNGDAIDINLYHTSGLSEISQDLSYPFDFDSTIDTSNLIDGNNFIINSNLKAITNGPKSYHINSGKSFGYFKIHTPNKQTTFSVTAYVSSEGNYDFGGCYVGTQIYDADRNAITSRVTDGNGKWLFMNSNSSSATYTTTLEADTDYYVQFYYTKDSSGDINEDRIIIKNMKFETYGSSDLYIFSPNENLGDDYQNVEFIDTVSIPEHKIYVKENSKYYEAKHITFNVENDETTIYTEIKGEE